MTRKRFTISLIVLAMSAGFMSGEPVARAAADFVIRAGASHPADPAKPFEYTRFYPETLKVHRGQAVTWTFSGFHTVTFMPSGGPARPYALRVDELPGRYARPEQWWQPSGCGQAGQAACVLTDTDTLISSGPPVVNRAREFTVAVDVPLGSYRYVCTIHPSMEGALDVVDDTTSVLSQSELDAQIAAEVATDTANAEALLEQDPGFTLDGDRKVWNVLLGDQTPDNHVAVLLFIPSSLTVAPGDGVRYFFDNNSDEPHTVSFPSELSGERQAAGQGPPIGKGGWGFFPACDFDDPLTGAPGVPGPFGIGPAPCPANLEFTVQPWMMQPQRAPGDVVAPGAIHDSGQLYAADAPDTNREIPGTGTYFPSEFNAEFPLPGAYTYECNVHVNLMTGSVTVS